MMWAPKLCNVPRKSYSLGYEVGFLNINLAKEFLRKAWQRKCVLTPIFANVAGQRG